MSSSSAAPRVGRPVERRDRRPSQERRWLIQAIRTQLFGARLLAGMATLIAISAGAWWIIGTTGSPLIGISFIALGLMIGVALWSFIGLMRMIGGAPVIAPQPTPPQSPAERPAPLLRHPIPPPP